MTTLRLDVIMYFILCSKKFNSEMEHSLKENVIIGIKLLLVCYKNSPKFCLLFGKIQLSPPERYLNRQFQIFYQVQSSKEADMFQ